MISSFRPPQKDIELPNPPTDSVSKMVWHPTANILAIASWSGSVRLYEISPTGDSQPRAELKHDDAKPMPILDICWSKDGQFLFTAGCDNAAYQWEVASQSKRKVGQHDQPIRAIACVTIAGQQFLATGGWDRALKFWNYNAPSDNPQPVVSYPLSERVYAMDASEKNMIIGTADRRIYRLDLMNPPPSGSTLPSDESTLKWQTRVIACFPPCVGAEGYAIGSTEGRIGFQYLDDPKKGYSFKCHRVDIAPGTVNDPNVSSGSQNVFPLHSITFHKVQGTFCTTGGDGSMAVWDGVARTKVKMFTAKELGNGDTDARPPVFGQPIVSTAFSPSHDILAYALSYDWAKGYHGAPAQGTNSTKVMLHLVKPDEVMKKKR
ncbi:RNA export factor gle2 [Cryptotrichosporon argae]